MGFPLIGAIAAPVIKAISSVVDQAVEDKDARNRIKAALQNQLIEGNLKELDAAMVVIVAEAQGGSFLQRTWRPITMLTFVGLIVAKWLGVTAPGVTEAVELELLGSSRWAWAGTWWGEAPRRWRRFGRHRERADGAARDR